MTTSITAVIVTHNSPPIVRRVVEALLIQTLPPERIVIVDSGSADLGPVGELVALSSVIEVIFKPNIGFAAANNLAMRLYPSDYFILVNPDAVLSDNWIKGAFAYAESPDGREAGILSSPLRGMDLDKALPTKFWDSLGIYRSRMGRWYDRGMRQPIADLPAPVAPYEPIAITGALMFLPWACYKALANHGSFFDEKFHTFKEDVEVSLRVRRAGYRLVMLPHLIAYHCRGWPKQRYESSYWARWRSSRNDVLIAARYYPAALPICILKHLYVTTVEPLLLTARRKLVRRC